MSETPPRTTTDAGIPAPSDEHSLSVGPNGPLLLQDHYLIQKMAQFNRERVPERVVHAKGGAAHGVFEVSNDVSQFTKAKVFQPGAKVDAFLRFSTVAGELGSPDTWRDPRGFALKLYTEDGNYDIVGNNTPIFFVRDPSKFQDFIRSQKRDPVTHLRSHEMQWDFWTLAPESTHQVMFLMTDRGTPRTWRHMHGFGSHTFMWVNAGGERFWVKYHFKTVQGIENFTDDEAGQMAGEDPNFHIRDLREAIDRGDHPEWKLEVQVMPVEEAPDYRFNPFDLTKVWPQGDYERIEVGRLALNRNPAHYHAEVEQAAFEPSNMVPGVGPSPDKMLLGRLFSYPDTHRYRIGANYLQLPINQPQSPVDSYNKDGQMQYHHSGDQPVYAPNSHGGPEAKPEYAEDAVWPAAGEMVRRTYELHAEDDDQGQSRTLYEKVLDDSDRAHLVDNIVGHASAQEVSDAMKDRVVAYWAAVTPQLGAKVANGLGRPEPAAGSAAGAPVGAPAAPSE